MATAYEILRWNLWKLKNISLIEYGERNNLFGPYDQELLNKLHYIYYCGLPISLLLLNTRVCEGRCYNKALLLTLGLQDYEYQLVDADVDFLTFSPYSCDMIKKHKLEHFGNHRFVQAIIKDGKRVVYDTTRGGMYDWDLYYKINNPKITKIYSKEEVQNCKIYQEIIEYNKKGIGEERFLLPVMFELFEDSIKSGCTYLYDEAIREELKKFKKDIDYEDIDYESIVAESNKENSHWHLPN